MGTERPKVVVDFGKCRFKASALFSIYTNFLVPGHNIKLHLDVPEFDGLDRLV